MAIDMSVGRIMTREVVTVSLTDPVNRVARLLWEHALTGVPVVEGRRVVGMITEFDLIARESEYEGPMYVPFLDAFFRVPGSAHPEQLRRILATTAGQLMTPNPITVTEDATVQEVASLMYEHHINPVPVVDAEQQLVGIVSRSDIIRLMVVEEEEHAE